MLVPLIIFSFFAVGKARPPAFPSFSQQCRDDAGPPWEDDSETFGQELYHSNSLAVAMLLPDGSCPAPVADACKDRGALTAYLEGPIDCAGNGWFCRILLDTNFGAASTLRDDLNFGYCNQTRNWDRDGHCHGSDDDSTFYWWVRDHWHRNYAGRLKCCCDWRSTKNVVNRCDYRKPLSRGQNRRCRDANEEHNKGYEGGCNGGSIDDERQPGGFDVVEPAKESCWEIVNFGPKENCRRGLCYDGDGGGQPESGDGPSTFELMGRGRCPSTHKHVADFEGCEDSARELELGKREVQEISSKRYPPGCFYWPKRRRVYWNRSERAQQSKSSKRRSICQTELESGAGGNVFELLHRGKCPKRTHVVVGDKDRCEEAARDLDIDYDSATVVRSKLLPSGCFVRRKNERLFFNNGKGRDRMGRTYRSVCERVN